MNVKFLKTYVYLFSTSAPNTPLKKTVICHLSSTLPHPPARKTSPIIWNFQKFFIYLHRETIIMMEETRKDEPTLVSEPAAIYYGTSQVTNPLAMLDQLGDMVKATSKTSEQLIGEHLAEKYNL